MPITLDGLDGFRARLAAFGGARCVQRQQARPHRDRRQSARRPLRGHDRRIASVRRHVKGSMSICEGGRTGPRSRASCNSPASISNRASMLFSARDAGGARQRHCRDGSLRRRHAGADPYRRRFGNARRPRAARSPVSMSSSCCGGSSAGRFPAAASSAADARRSTSLRLRKVGGRHCQSRGRAA